MGVLCIDYTQIVGENMSSSDSKFEEFGLSEHEIQSAPLLKKFLVTYRPILPEYKARVILLAALKMADSKMHLSNENFEKMRSIEVELEDALLRKRTEPPKRQRSADIQGRRVNRQKVRKREALPVSHTHAKSSLSSVDKYGTIQRMASMITEKTVLRQVELQYDQCGLPEAFLKRLARLMHRELNGLNTAEEKCELQGIRKQAKSAQAVIQEQAVVEYTLSSCQSFDGVDPSLRAPDSVREIERVTQEMARATFRKEKQYNIESSENFPDEEDC